MIDTEITERIFALKRKKAELQRKRQRLVDDGRKANLLDKMISSVDRERNTLMRFVKKEEAA